MANFVPAANESLSAKASMSFQLLAAALRRTGSELAERLYSRQL